MPTPNSKFTISASDKTKAAFRSVKGNLKSLSRAIFSTKTAIGVLAGAAGLGLIIRSSLKATDAIGKLSKTYGIATKDLAAFSIAADIGGSSLETFSKAVKNVASNVFDFVRTGTGEAKDAFDQLGISVKDLTPILNDNVAIMGLISDRLNKMEDGTIKVAVAKDLLGGRAVNLLPALAGGAEAFKRYRKEAELTGKALSQDAVKGVEEANDSITRLGHLFEGLRDQTVASLAPAIQSGVDAFRDWIIEIAETRGGIKEFARESAVTILEGVKDMITGLQTVIDWIEQIRDKAVEFGIIKKQVDIESVAGQRRLIASINDSLRYYDLQNIRNEDYRMLIAARSEAQEKLNVLQRQGEQENISLLEQGKAALDGVIQKIRDRKAAESSGSGSDSGKKTGGGLAAVDLSPLVAQEQLIQQNLSSIESANDELYRANALWQGGLISVESYTEKVRGAAGAFKGMYDGQQAALAGVRESLSSGVQSISESLMTEEESLRASYENRQLILDEANARELIGDTRHKELTEKLEVAHQEKLKDLQAQAARERFAVASGMFSNLAQLMNAGSKRQFELGKKAAKATAIIKGFEAIQSSYAAGAKIGGPILGAAYAATAALATKANIDAISAQSFSGGGSLSGSTTGGNTGDLTSIPSESSSASQSQSQVTFIVVGGNGSSSLDPAAMDQLMDQLSHEINNSSKIVIRRDSPQALEIARAVNA